MIFKALYAQFSFRKLSFVFWLIGTMLIALKSFHIPRPKKAFAMIWSLLDYFFCSE